MQQDEKDELSGREIVATQHSSVDELRDNGSVKEHSELIREPVVIDGHIFMRTVSRNGQPLSGKYLEREKDREQKFRESLRKGTENGDDFKIDRELFSRFLVSIEGEERVNGRAAWVLSFHPRPGEKQERSRTERIVNHLAGKVWVDEEDYEFSRVDIALTEPVNFYGIVGRIHSLHYKLEQQQYDHLWTPVSSDMNYSARAVVISLHQHVTNSYDNFRHRPAVN